MNKCGLETVKYSQLLCWITRPKYGKAVKRSSGSSRARDFTSGLPMGISSTAASAAYISIFLFYTHKVADFEHGDYSASYPTVRISCDDNIYVEMSHLNIGLTVDSLYGPRRLLGVTQGLCFYVFMTQKPFQIHRNYSMKTVYACRFKHAPSNEKIPGAVLLTKSDIRNAAWSRSYPTRI